MKSIILFALLSSLINAKNFSYCDSIKKIKGATVCAIAPSKTHNEIKDFAGKSFLNKILGLGFHSITIPDELKSPIAHLHFVGTFGRPYRPKSEQFTQLAFLEEAVANNRIVINLAYNNRFPINGPKLCSNDGKKVNNCAGLVRLSKITGDQHTHLDKTGKVNSIQNRLLKLVDFLKENNAPFTKYLSSNISNYEVSGHSQGAGISLYLAKNFGVKRACLFAGGYDVGDDINASGASIADWITDSGYKTPIKEIRALVHKKDKHYKVFNLTYELLGLYEIGNAQDVSTDLEQLSTYEGSAVRSAHSAIITATQLRSVWKKICFD